MDNKSKIRDMKCSVCGFPPPSDVHHWKTRGSGGNDEMDNLVSLCRKHHMEFHSIGRKSFYLKYGSQLDFFRKINELPELKL